MGASGPETADVEALKLEVTELRQKIEQLTEENNELKTKVKIISEDCLKHGHLWRFKQKNTCWAKEKLIM